MGRYVQATYFDVYFHLDPDCEPSPPAVVNEVLYDAVTPANHHEWFEIYNRCGRELNLGGWVVTDEEKPAGQEGSYVFPDATKLGAAQVWTVAQMATKHKETYGDNPDFELIDTDAAVTDMLLSELWSQGSGIYLNRECVPGVCDPLNGDCVAHAFEDGSLCTDSNLCTSNDTCLAGLCKGQALDCTYLSEDCNLGICDPLTGSC